MRHEVPLEEIEDAALDADLDIDSAIRTDYEGRGMYGRGGCLGLVWDRQSELIDFVIFMAEKGWGDAMRSGSAQDSMGLSVITYWPDVEVIEQSEDDYE